MSESRTGPTITVTPISEADLNEGRMGSFGNPSYEEQFGQSSAPLGTTGVTQPTVADLEFQAKMAEARALNPMAFAQLPTQPALEQPEHSQYLEELEKFKKLYGDSENEKGQLRKNQQELMEAFNGLMTQYEALQGQAQQPQPWAPQQAAPMPYGQPQYGPPAPYFDPFEGIGDDDVVQGKQIKGLIERTVAPAIAGAYQQAQQSQQRAAALERQLMLQSKAASGITALDEWRLVAKNPWLRSLPEPNRLQALASLKAAEGVQAQVQMAPQGQADSQQRIVNKVTYIEGSAPQQTADTSQAAIQAARERDYAVAMSKPNETGERARALRTWANKYGINLGQNPSDLAR